VIFFIWLTEFAAIATAEIVCIRSIAESSATPLYIVATFVSAIFTSGILILLVVTVYVAQFTGPILLPALTLTLLGRHQIVMDRVVSGTVFLLIPISLVASVAFGRPVAANSPVWPVLGTVSLLVAAVLIALTYLQHSHILPKTTTPATTTHPTPSLTA
jgi:hypothetical protein